MGIGCGEVCDIYLSMDNAVPDKRWVCVGGYRLWGSVCVAYGWRLVYFFKMHLNQCSSPVCVSGSLVFDHQLDAHRHVSLSHDRHDHGKPFLNHN